MTKPAVEGTLSALRAAHKHRVKRVVVTSSVVAVCHKLDPVPDPINEEHWTPVEKCTELTDAYQLSKTLAEKAAWDYQKSLPENERFEIAFINPGFVMGPALVGEGFTSGNFISAVMKGFVGTKSGSHVSCVSIYETAEAHLKAIKVPEAANQRFLLVN